MVDRESASELALAQRPRSLARRLLLLAVGIAIVAIGPLAPHAHWLEAPGAIVNWIRGHGPGGLALAFAGMVACLLVGMPRLVFCPIGGALLGFWGGLGFCAGGAVASHYLAFLLVRGSGGRLRIGLDGRLAFLRADPGLGGVILARLVPLPGMLVTLALAASEVGHGAYLLGNAIVLAPEAVPFVLLGSGGLHADPGHLARIIAASLACVGFAWLLARHLARTAPPSAQGLADRDALGRREALAYPARRPRLWGRLSPREERALPPSRCGPAREASPGARRSPG